MPLKYSLIFRATTGQATADQPANVIQRVGGWSENWYDNQSSIGTTSLADAARLAQKRAAMLPVSASVVGVRIQPIDPPLPSQLIRVNFPGQSSLQQDIPQMGLLVSVPSDNGQHISRYTLRGLADNCVTAGEYTPTAAMIAAFNTWADEIADANWYVRGRDNTVPVYPLASVAADGTFTTTVDAAFVVGNRVQIRRSFEPATQLQRGHTSVISSKVSTATDTVWKLRDWPYGDTINGDVRLVRLTVFNAARPIPVQVAERKVGNPITRFRGRRSKRR